METIIDSAIKNSKEELNFSDELLRNQLSDDLTFGTVCYKYFYNHGKYDISDFKNSFTDGNNDGGIDLIAVNEGDISKSLVLIQSKNV